jgi:hypothetical protein
MVPKSRAGANVSSARHAPSWTTPEDPAAATRLAIVQISRVERGVREVRVTALVRLSRSLEVTPQQLLEGVL